MGAVKEYTRITKVRKEGANTGIFSVVLLEIRLATLGVGFHGGLAWAPSSWAHCKHRSIRLDWLLSSKEELSNTTQLTVLYVLNILPT